MREDKVEQKHIIDARGILQIQGESVDNNYLIKWAEKLSVRGILKELLKTVRFC